MTKRSLYVGIDPPDQNFLHCPLITTCARLPPPELVKQIISATTALIFTSKSGVKYFKEIFGTPTHIKTFYAVGKATARCIEENFGIKAITAKYETAEGVVELLKTQSFTADDFILWPHAAGARSVISDYMRAAAIKHFSFVLYDTHFIRPDPLPPLEEVDEIFFSSPSTIDAFIAAYGSLPKDKVFRTIGPVTQAHLEELFLR